MRPVFPRRSSHFMRLLIACLIIVPVVAACRAAPQEARHVRRGADVVAAGTTVTVQDTVVGDVVVTGGALTFTGAAGGDYLGAGGRQEIRGRVIGSARAAGGEIVLAGIIERNATAAGGRVEIARTALVEGNVYLAGGDVRVLGDVQEYVQAVGGEVFLDGPIGRGAFIQAGRLRVGPNARIAGNLQHRVPERNVEIDPAAQIGGEVIALPPPRWMGRNAIRILWHLGFLLAGALVIALFPRTAAAASIALRERPGASVGWGLLWIIALPISAALVAVTFIGLPLSLVAIAFYMISLYLGRSAFAVWLGSRLMGVRVRVDRAGLVLAFLLGGLILVVIGLIPVVGPLVTVVATCVGLGATLLVANPRRPYAIVAATEPD